MIEGLVREDSPLEHDMAQAGLGEGVNLGVISTELKGDGPTKPEA